MTGSYDGSVDKLFLTGRPGALTFRPPLRDCNATRLRRATGIAALGVAGWLPGTLACAQTDLTGLGKIVVGTAHKCALTAPGGVKCWGYNYYGQLGDNTTTQRLTPVDVSGLSNGVTAIAAGNSHTCALTVAGGVKCWGYNFYGQLGDNTVIQRLTAVDVLGLTSGVTAIAAGIYHSCALNTAGGVKCWGYNSDGELGDTTTTQRLTPVDVAGLASGVISITAGELHTCAQTTARGVKCWGYDSAKWEATPLLRD
jgi:alpha-tubulin suppressor-like RCC1 family protein